MPHHIAGFGTIVLPGRCRLQADRFHLLGPLLVVIPAPARRAEMVLPQMDHFMCEGGEHFFLWPVPEVGRVQGDLIGERAVSTTKSITTKIPVALLASLQRDKAVRKLALEQRAIQSLVCLLQRIVSFTRWFDGLIVGIGHGRSPRRSARLRFALGCASQFLE